MRNRNKEDVNMTLQQLKYVIAIADNNSFNKAATKLYISQPSLSASIRMLEEELEFSLFNRTSKGITITDEGYDFIEKARIVLDQFHALENKSLKKRKKYNFGVSSQHYGFAVRAFSDLVRSEGIEECRFNYYEEKTTDIIEHVVAAQMELGIIFMNTFNKNVIKNILKRNNLTFHKLVECNICVMVHESHPLAKQEMLTEEDLTDYPFIAFESGKHNSHYFAEEYLNEDTENVNIEVSDRACMMMLMQELNAYTHVAGIASENIVNKEFVIIPIDEKKKTEVGYIKKANIELSEYGKKYIDKLISTINKQG